MGDTSDQRLASSAAMTTVAGALAQDGFARVSAEEMRALLGPEGLADWKGFADSWDGLGLDLFMADGGRYRRRRFGAFAMREGVVRRKAHQPHTRAATTVASMAGLHAGSTR